MVMVPRYIHRKRVPMGHNPPPKMWQRGWCPSATERRLASDSTAGLLARPINLSHPRGMGERAALQRLAYLVLIVLIIHVVGSYLPLCS